MRVLIFHGYLLAGTGSNVYNASLAQALRGLGHEVHLLCQDRDAAALPWVGGEGPGSVTVHVPDIGGLLPVFVDDRYEGFEVKTFPELSEEELGRYLDANVAAVRGVVEAVGEPDAALANHLIMGPVILARAGLRYAIKVHGSDLSYTVRPHPERFVPFAREGLAGATGVLVGSRHTAEDLWATIPDPDLPQRTRLGPPGVDVGRFRVRERDEALSGVGALADRLATAAAEGAFGRDGPEAAEAVRGWSQGDPRVLFVGKLLVNKGVDLLVAAWPLVRRRHLGATLLLAGFGAYRPGVEALFAALGAGDLEAAREVATQGRSYEGGEPGPLPILSAFLADPPERYAEAAREAVGSVRISGRLEHDEVAEVMPAADVLVMPSTFPEAFGMVAAEGAACGVAPVSADHSGMREVSSRLAAALEPELAPLLSFDVGPGAVEELAARIGGWLSLDRRERERVRRSLAARVAELWSWERVAGDVLSASRGELSSLAPVVSD
ncbi:MAG: glycosyltransferase family 4 protein [Actinomycetota bacterium]|nr:glycosyltransferase family 4 protein [Actinomycetota bacterium]